MQHPGFITTNHGLYLGKADPATALAAPTMGNLDGVGSPSSPGLVCQVRLAQVVEVEVEVSFLVIPRCAARDLRFS